MGHVTRCQSLTQACMPTMLKGETIYQIQESIIQFKHFDLKWDHQGCEAWKRNVMLLLLLVQIHPLPSLASSYNSYIISFSSALNFFTDIAFSNAGPAFTLALVSNISALILLLN